MAGEENVVRARPLLKIQPLCLAEMAVSGSGWGCTLLKDQECDIQPPPHASRRCPWLDTHRNLMGLVTGIPGTRSPPSTRRLTLGFQELEPAGLPRGSLFIHRLWAEMDAYPVESTGQVGGEWFITPRMSNNRVSSLYH